MARTSPACAAESCSLPRRRELDANEKIELKRTKVKNIATTASRQKPLMAKLSADLAGFRNLQRELGVVVERVAVFLEGDRVLVKFAGTPDADLSELESYLCQTLEIRPEQLVLKESTSQCCGTGCHGCFVGKPFVFEGKQVTTLEGFENLRLCGC
jgi:hypothetical protein